MDMETGQDRPQERSRAGAWRQYALVAAVAAVVMLWRLDATVMEDHECHLAITARTMAADRPDPWIVEGDEPYEVPSYTPLRKWLVPVENGRPRLVKTPLPYWVAAGVGILNGREVTTLTARLPAAVCAVLTAWAALWLGRRLLSPRAALMGAVMLATSVGAQKWGRDARPEMMLCLLMTAAVACFHAGAEARTRRGHVAWMAAFWLTMGLANLAKQLVPLMLAWPILAWLCWRQQARGQGDGPALRTLRRFALAAGAGLGAHILVSLAPPLRWWRATGLSDGAGAYLSMALCVGVPLLGYLLASGGWRAAVRLLPTAVPGMFLMLAMFVPWMLYMVRLFPDFAPRVFAGQTAERAAGTGLWTVEPPQLYLVALLTFVLPWVAFLPGALAAPLMRRFADRRAGAVLLWLWSAGLVGLFSAAAAKRDHYILPMLPAVCLLMGFIAEEVLFRHAWISPALARGIVVGYGLTAASGLAVVAAVWYVAVERASWAVMFPTVLLAAAPVGLAAWRAARGRLGGAVWLIAAGITVVYTGWRIAEPLNDPRRAVHDFALAVKAIVPPDAELAHWGDPQAKVVFYAGRTIPAAQWAFRRRDPDADEQVIAQRVTDWLRLNPGRMPWIVGYLPSPQKLWPLGYEPVHCQTERHFKRLMYTLFRRSPPTPADGGGRT